MSSIRSNTRAPEGPRRSRWLLILVLLWAVLAFRIGLAVARGESLRDDLSLPTVALFVATAILGSRIWWFFEERAKAVREKARS